MSKNHYDDFLSILINDPYFKDNDDMIIDECMTFMFASTQTVTILITNALFFFTMKTNIRDRVRKELI